jgi:hypothetical protein
MQGQLSIGMRPAPTGEICVFIQWPDGSGFLLPKGQALCFAFSVLATTRNLFRDVEELDAAVLAAKEEADVFAERQQRQMQQVSIVQ